MLFTLSVKSLATLQKKGHKHNIPTTQISCLHKKIQQKKINRYSLYTNPALEIKRTCKK